FRGKSIDKTIRVTTHDGQPGVFATVHLEQHKEPDENSNDGHDVASKCDGEAQQEANKRDNADEVQDGKQHGHASKKDDRLRGVKTHKTILSLDYEENQSTYPPKCVTQ